MLALNSLPMALIPILRRGQWSFPDSMVRLQIRIGCLTDIPSLRQDGLVYETAFSGRAWIAHNSKYCRNLRRKKAF